MEVLNELRLQLKLQPNAPGKVKKRWYTAVAERLGPNASDLAMDFLALRVTVNEVNNYYSGTNNVSNEIKPGSTTTTVTQTAGGNMTGVNAAGEQKTRDINVFSQDLDQAGASISPEIRAALIEGREELDKVTLDAALKPMVMEQYDKLAEELKKGKAHNPGVVAGLWAMVSGAVKMIPGAAACITALEKLHGLLGGHKTG